MSDETTELQGILDEFEHECFMLRVEASETRAKDDVVRKSYERIRDEFAGRIAATLGSDAKPCYAAEANYKRCKYGTNRGWCDDAPFLVWDDTGHLFITMGGLKTWDVTDDAKKWFAEMGGGKLTAEQVREAVEKHWHDLPDEYDMPEATALPEYSYDWQAIADDLNAALGEQPAKSGADALIRRARYMSHSIQGNLGRCLYRRKDVAEMEEVSETLMELANELNATLGSGTCKNDWAEFGKFKCSECGLQVDSISTCTTSPIPIAFCPRCGRKVDA